jgi:16S rRNA G966 N2-methylase RsmD
LQVARDLVRRRDRFDLVFLDPPYAEGDAIETAALVPLLSSGGRVVRQSDADAHVDASPLRVTRKAAYGRNVFTFLEAP